MQSSSRKQHVRIRNLATAKQQQKQAAGGTSWGDMDVDDPVTKITKITKKALSKKKNLSQAKSPLRFTNKYRKTPRSIDVSEKRALRRVIARDLTDRERLNEVLAQIDRTRALPKTSKYAVHKLAILGKAKQLLEEKIEKRGVQDAGGELETLLRELRID